MDLYHEILVATARFAESASTDVRMPIGWILTAIGALATGIAGLAGVMWNFVRSRLEAQDKIIDAQSATIAKLQNDIDRMSTGCGHEECHWRIRFLPNGHGGDHAHVRSR